MAVKHVDLDDCYTPKTTTEDIVVDVTVGDAQSGAYVIFLGTKLIKANKPANLGKSAKVKGKTTTISATIVDVLEETNWTSITVSVKEGEGNETTYGPYKTQAENHLDTVIYTLKLVNQ